MKKATQTPRIRTALAGLATAAALSVAFVGITSADATSPHHAVNTPGVAVWAQTNGVSGLSPASAAANAAVNTPGLAAWAQTNGVSGLSPASAAAKAAVNSSGYDLSELRSWAAANGMAGLSPVSLRSSDSR